MMLVEVVILRNDESLIILKVEATEFAISWICGVSYSPYLTQLCSSAKEWGYNWKFLSWGDCLIKEVSIYKMHNACDIVSDQLR